MLDSITIREHHVFAGGVLVLLLLVGIAAAAPYDDVTININVSQTVSIDVTPSQVNWTQLNVGETGTPEYFTVTNVGSVNITALKANITSDSSNPYGTGSPSNYNAGEFVLLNSSSYGFFYVAKSNWNETIPGGVTAPDDFTEGNGTGYFGMIRTSSDGDVGQDYYYFTNRTAASGDCLTGSGELYIGLLPKNVSSSGTTDFSSAANFETVTLDSSGIGNVSRAGFEFDYYCVAVSAECSEVTLFRWYSDLDTSGGCSNDVDFYDGTTPNELNPGENTWFWLEPKIPNGVPDGDVAQGTLYIIATGG